MRGGVPHQGRLPGQQGQVTCLGGVGFLHVNAEGGVPCLTEVMFIGAFIFSLNIWKPHTSTLWLLILHVKALSFFFLLREGRVPHLHVPGFPHLHMNRPKIDWPIIVLSLI